MPNQSTRNPSGDALRADASQGHGVRRVGAPGSQLGTAAEEARWDRTSHRALHCPSWDRTRTLLIQSGSEQSQSSGNALVHREFASSVVGKKTRKIGPCRTLQRQKRCQCHRRNDTEVGAAFRRVLVLEKNIETKTETMTPIPYQRSPAQEARGC